MEKRRGGTMMKVAKIGMAHLFSKPLATTVPLFTGSVTLNPHGYARKPMNPTRQLKHLRAVGRQLRPQRRRGRRLDGDTASWLWQPPTATPQAVFVRFLEHNGAEKVELTSCLKRNKDGERDGDKIVGAKALDGLRSVRRDGIDASAHLLRSVGRSNPSLVEIFLILGASCCRSTLPDSPAAHLEGGLGCESQRGIADESILGFVNANIQVFLRDISLEHSMAGLSMSHDLGGSYGEKVLLNGDVYVGKFDGLLPHGVGRYTWSDGIIYDGQWEKSKITGRGKICWPSGATYEGEFCGGFLHGSGTLFGVDGSVYKGLWRMNKQHGKGIKAYSNLDEYDGLWREGWQDGHGTYRWSNGNTYTGNWKAGKMYGKGVMKWANGDIFYGNWSDGLENGSGCYKYGDRSIYVGIWSKGLKDGHGTFFPPGSKLPSQLRYLESVLCDNKVPSLSHSLSYSAEEPVSKKPPKGRCRINRWRIPACFLKSKRISHRSSSLGVWSIDTGCSSLSENTSQTQCSSYDSQHVLVDTCVVAYDREYMQGVLITERISYFDFQRSQRNKRNWKMKKQSRGPGENIYRGHRSYYLMLNLQLGIRNKMCQCRRHRQRGRNQEREKEDSEKEEEKRQKVNPKPCPGCLVSLMQASLESSNIVIEAFCESSSIITAIANITLNLYTVGKITPVPMREVRSSDFGSRARIRMYFPCMGSQFTPPHNSVAFFWKDYCPMGFRNLREMFKIDAADYMMSICGGRDKVRFVVMGNMFRTELRIHRRYDLKGSSIGRCTGMHKTNGITTLKDLDLSYVFHLEKSWRESLFRAPEHLKAYSESRNHPTENAGSPDNFSESQLHEEIRNLPKGLRLVAHEPSSVTSLPGSHIRGSTLRASAAGNKEVDLLLPGTGRQDVLAYVVELLVLIMQEKKKGYSVELRVQLGVNMPAQANLKLLHNCLLDSAETDPIEVYDVVLYFGIIDILQEYNMTKKIEHACKSLKYDPLLISAIEPKTYSKRFISFLKEVFPE
ncbi:hypothetical protein ZIOFF_056858 [Zingiber officinale]|uniref:1-phosphatidylinositol-4-phosphate 5-kinase n=1 Tax=Zingiber officinale TaxID=94328 RepID=A0A8J5FII5_ZINOF|nr:hypothetical protein ZIOFF_056858 [Zingiber officinale]